jgi:hypothetical protein
MSKETPDEPTGSEQLWRRLLREPDALPGQALEDKDAAWDKLFERLNKKPRRRFWDYRIAAACLLILLIPASRLWQDRPAREKGLPMAGRGLSPEKGLSPAEKLRPAPIVRPEQPLTPEPAAPESVAHKTPAPVPAMAVAVKPSPAGPARKSRSLPPKSPVMTRPAAPAPAKPAVVVAQLIPAKSANPASLPTSEPAAISPPLILAESKPSTPAHPAKPPKKEWKVVDINDLEPGHSRPQGMLAGRRPGMFRLGLGIGNTGTPADPPSPQREEPRLKINLSTQNR